MYSTNSFSSSYFCSGVIHCFLVMVRYEGQRGQEVGQDPVKIYKADICPDC